MKSAPRPDYRDKLQGPESVSVVWVACRIAQRFQDSAPTVEWLRSTFGMSRASAYRWRRAWLDAGEGQS